jgi:hypothetical protein
MALSGADRPTESLISEWQAAIGLSYGDSMENKPPQISRILMRRLRQKGIEASVLPGFIRDLKRILSSNPRMSLSKVTERLRMLGWDEFELDYRTLELARVCFDNIL